MKHIATPHRQTSKLGIGLGLALALACMAQAAMAEAPSLKDTELAAKSLAAFGKQIGQSFDASAVTIADLPIRSDSMSVTLAPGKGAEVKARLAKGQSLVFHWSASADVAVDMHGERKDANDEYTSYAIEGSQKQASGTLTAPFDGSHGWYWKNLGKQAVTVRVSVTGFHAQLFRPGQQ